MEILYIVLAIIMLLIVFVITYNIWDNRRIKVTKNQGLCGTTKAPMRSAISISAQ